MTPKNDDENRDRADEPDDADATKDASVMSDAEAAAAVREGDPLTNEATAATRWLEAEPTVTDGATEPASMSDAEVASTLRDADPISVETSTPTIAPLHEPAALREPAPLRVPGVLPAVDATAEPIVAAESHDAALRADDAAPAADVAPVAFAQRPIVETEVVAAAPIGPADEPAVTEVAPLAVVGGVAAVAAAPVVVRTRTGLVALDVQPEPVVEPKPTPVAVRGLNPEPCTIVTIKPARLASLDIFRGLTIALMVLVNNEGVGKAYEPLDHAAWHGWTPTDLVFPFFLFIVGVATPFSLGKRAAIDGASRGTLFGRIWLRALSLVLLGWLLSGAYSPLPTAGWPETGYWFTKVFRAIGFPFAIVSIFALLTPWWPKRVATFLPIVIAVLLLGYCIAMHFVRAKAIANGWPADAFGGGFANPDRLRIPGVLQRIGVCYGVAATLALFGGRFVAWLAIVVLFAGYSWLMLGAPSFHGHTPGSLTPEGNFAHAVDVAVLERSHLENGVRVYTQKHTWRDYADNEGIVSTLPAIGTALIGVLVGWWLRRGHTTSAEKCAGLLARGVVVTCAGVLLSWWLMPINKNLWTPSFSVFTAGLGMLTLGAIFWKADVRGRRWYFWPFKVMGMNAIAAFVASSLVVRLSSLIPFADPKSGKATNAVSWLKHQAADGVAHASDWMSVHAAWAPTLNTPQNTSLAGALAFVLVIFALMLVLYVCRIFVKV